MKASLEQRTEQPFTEGHQGNEGRAKTPASASVLCLLSSGLRSLGSLLFKPLPAALLTAALVLLNPRPAGAAPGNVDPSFDPGSEMDSYVRAIVTQSDGKIVAAGRFRTVPSAVRQGVARFNADGTLDATFADPVLAPLQVAISPDGIYGLALQADGRIVIGGTFSSVNGVARNHIARLNADGSLDRTFQEGMAGTDNMRVYAVAIQSDGKILLGGNFKSVNGVARNHFARLNADGSLDTTFLDHPEWGEYLWPSEIILQPDGKILINVDQVARLNPDGSVDTSFADGGPGDGVASMALQPDGKILVGYAYVANLTRLNANGSVDTSFSSGAGVGVASMALQPDGKILVGGVFNVTGVGQRSLVRLNANGSLDSSFAPALDQDGQGQVGAYVYALARQTDGRIVIGGGFGFVNGQRKPYLARLNPDASLDTTFADYPSGPGTYSWIYGLAVQDDDKVLIGGTFDSVSGVEQSGLARLNHDGSLDSSFAPTVGGSRVYALAQQSDARILIGGVFTSVNGVARGSIARLHADGSLDTSFQNGMSGLAGGSYRCWAVALQPDGKILIGGGFTSVNGVARSCIARLHADGSLDTTFQNGMSGLSGGGQTDYPCCAFALQPDAKVLVGGGFISVNGVARKYLARLNANGSLDTSFLSGMAGPDNAVWCLALQPDGKILVGGKFTSVNGAARQAIARLNSNGSLDTSFQVVLADGSPWVCTIVLQSDGKMLIGGDDLRIEGVTPYALARLNPNGSLDRSFIPVTGLGRGFHATVYRVAFQADGRILVGGRFSSLNGYARGNVARLLAYDDLGISDCCCTNGLFAFNLTGPPGCQALIQASTDLRHWITLHGCQLTNSPLGFVDPESPLYPKRFYRLMDAAGVALMEQQRWSGGQFHLNLVGELGRTVVVEASSNLADWTPIATKVLSTDPIPFTDPQSALFPQRFYRLLKP